MSIDTLKPSKLTCKNLHAIDGNCVGQYLNRNATLATTFEVREQII